MTHTRTVVTGIGFSLPGGSSWEELIESEKNKKTGFIPWPTAGAPPFNSSKIAKINKIPTTKYLRISDTKVLNRFVIMSVNSAGDALKQSGYLDCQDSEISNDIGCIIGTSRPEFAAYAKFIAPILDKQISKINPLLFPLLARSAACGQICIRFGLQGYCPTVGFGHISGPHALIRSLEVIKQNRAKRVLVGGAETLSTLSLKHNRHLYADYYSRMKDNTDDLLVPSEGACFFMLESSKTASTTNSLAIIGDFKIGKLKKNSNLKESFKLVISSLLEDARLKWNKLSFISTSLSPAKLAHEEIENQVLSSLCEENNHTPIISAPKYFIGESEACATAFQIVNAVQFVSKNGYVGRINNNERTVKTTSFGPALVCVLDKNNNYFVQIVYPFDDLEKEL
tara:strand:+ start:2335 stop:3525 length:1191 start_codon:yes stop_codon:yes gene_type:complete